MTSILYIGGTGTISAACVRRSLERGHDVSILHRGTAGRRPVPDCVREFHADVRDPEAVRAALGATEFDVVADFLTFVPAQLDANLDVFEGRTGQYLFVSSASAYQKPPAHLPVTERTPLVNPFWQYSRDKIDTERRLAESGVPFTIVRPSHTYDERMIPTLGKWTDIVRLREGRPVIVHGDGTSLWTITHADDVAVAITGLMGLPGALSEDFTVTGTHAPTWDRIYRWLAAAAGVEEPDLVHLASETIAAFAPALGPTLLGDKAHSMVFDNAKVSALVPEFATTTTFEDGARQIVDWFDRTPEAQSADRDLDALFDRIAAHARAAG